MYHLVLLANLCAASAVAQHPAMDDPLHGEVITDYSPYEKAWADFKTKFGRQYGSSEEEDYRKQLFMNKIKEFEAHNKDYVNGRTTYWKDVNKFTDMTGEEFASYLQLEPAEPTSGRVKRQSEDFCTEYTPTSQSPPDRWDWRDKGYVSPVKDQGQCGVCWAFGTTGAIESQLRIQTQGRKKDTLSEQQLVDCFAKACKGSFPELAYKYIKNVGGIMPDKAYSYTSGITEEAGRCRFDKNKVVAKVTGCRYITDRDETAMMSAVRFQGPLTVGIDISEDFQDYTANQGIFEDRDCSVDPVGRHCVLIIGYGTRGRTPYWIAKNSWGDDEGDQGYWLMLRNANTCRLAEIVNFPLVNPDSQGSSGGTGGTGDTGGTGGMGSTKSFATVSSGKLLLVICHCIFAVLITSLTALY